MDGFNQLTAISIMTDEPESHVVKQRSNSALDNLDFRFRWTKQVNIYNFSEH